jgi:hypothetical protein
MSQSLYQFGDFGIGPPCCIGCGYFLLGLPEGEVCPECGAKRLPKSLTLMGHSSVLNPAAILVTGCLVLGAVCSYVAGERDTVGMAMAFFALTCCLYVLARHLHDRWSDSTDTSLFILTPSVVHWVENGKLKVTHTLGMDAKLTLARHPFGGFTFRVTSRATSMGLWMPIIVRSSVAEAVGHFFSDLPPTLRPQIGFRPIGPRAAGKPTDESRSP